MKYFVSVLAVMAALAALCLIGCSQQQAKPTAAPPPSASPSAMARFSAGRAQADQAGLAASAAHAHMTGPSPGVQPGH